MATIGTKFTNLFRYANDDDSANNHERRKNQRNSPADGTQILVIDDSKTAQHLLKKIINQAGYEVLQAFDGESGIALAQQYKPVLIIMDVVMPGISGFQATRMIRKDPEISDIPIIITSGNKQATNQFWLSKIGANQYLTKPFTRGDLFVLIDKVLYPKSSSKGWDTKDMHKDVIEADTSYATDAFNIHEELEVLIVDDSKTVQHVMKKMFMQRGFHVLQAYDGKEGIILAKKHKPALIIMDVMMPGINGFQATRYIKKDQEIAYIPIIMISGSKQASEKFWASKIGIDHYMTKPFSRTDLFEAIDNTLQLNSTASNQAGHAVINAMVEPDSSYAGKHLNVV